MTRAARINRLLLLYVYLHLKVLNGTFIGENTVGDEENNLGGFRTGIFPCALYSVRQGEHGW